MPHEEYINEVHSGLETLDGCSAATRAAYAFSESLAIYPITPSTPAAQLADEMAAKGVPNAFGDVCTVTEMQSEAGAAGTLHGVMSAGALSSTFTASQGLLLMIPNIYKCVGERVPAVFHVAARSIATHALSIFGDHSDLAAAARTGAAFLGACSVQEAFDMSAISHLSAISARHPFIHFFDGFRTSHAIEQVHVVRPEQLARLIDVESLDLFRATSMNHQHPSQRGTAQNPDVFMQAAEAANVHNGEIAGIVARVMEEYGELTGRHYKPYEYHGPENATDVIVVMGSGSLTCREASAYLHGQGRKTGVLTIRLYRPLDAGRFVAALPRSARRIAVLDRVKDSLAARDPLFSDVATVLADTGRMGNVDVLTGGRFGLSSKEFTPGDAVSVFNNLIAEDPKRVFTVGINDDVTKLSLNPVSVPSLLPEGTHAAVTWGLGGDGSVGAMKASSKIIGDAAGLFSQAYNQYSSEKALGVTTSFLRFGPKPITSPYIINNEAEYVGVHSFKYIERFPAALTRSAAPGATFVLNAPAEMHSVEALERAMPPRLRRAIADKNLRLFVIDGAAVAKQAKIPFINVAMQTVMLRSLNIFSPERVVELLKESMARTYARKGEHIVAKNCHAVELAIDALVEIKYDHERWAKATFDNPNDPHRVERQKSVCLTPAPFTPERVHERSEFQRDIADVIAGQHGDDLPVSVFAKHDLGTFVPMSTADGSKRSVAALAPIWDPTSCIQCNQCVLACPHSVIRSFVLTEDEAEKAGGPSVPLRDPKLADKKLRFKIQAALSDCTGCALCATICPMASKGVLKMEPVEERRAADQKTWEVLEASGAYQRAAELFTPTTAKAVAFQKPYFEYSGACGGCGHSPMIKLLTQLFGAHMVIAASTGCNTIYSGSYPVNPFTTDANGHGPAWSNSLFEDGAEYGLGMLLASLHRRASAKRLAEACIASESVPKGLKTLLKQWIAVFDDRVKSGELAGAIQNKVRELLASAAEMDDVVSAFARPHVLDSLAKPSNWIFMGDGAAFDIGYGGLDAVLSSGQNINVMIFNNELYANTGGQRASSTQIGAVAKFAAAGKDTPAKDLGALAMDHPNTYVAQVAVGANTPQCIRAMIEAEAHKGPSVIIAATPCIEWGIKGGMKNQHQAQKMAVRSGMWNLFRYNPGNEFAAKPSNPLTIDSKEPTVSPLDYLAMQNRFNILTRTDPERAAKLHAELARDVLRRYRSLTGRRDGWKPFAEEQADLDVAVSKTMAPPTAVATKAEASKAATPKPAASKAASPKPAAKPAADDGPLTILFATETGNSEEAAGYIYDELSAGGVDVKEPVATEDYDLDSVASLKRLILVASTTGDGDVPGMAEDFMAHVEESDLSGLTFYAFGLGNTDYDNFCGGIKALQTALTGAGATAGCATGYGDNNDDDDFRTALEPWTEKLTKLFE